MNLKGVLGYLALGFVVWWIIENPGGGGGVPAHVVHNIGAFLTDAAHGLSSWFAVI